ncbi:MAG: hypothetical protein VZQ83_00595 [Eubacterium sp.]|nr:hypothetical protein [Eubacterium sp.]
MDLEQHFQKLLNELIDGIDRGDFDSNVGMSDRYTYDHLRALFAYREDLDGAKDLYEQIFDRAVDYGTKYVCGRIRKGEKVRVRFLTYSAAQWQAEKLYCLLAEDERFDVGVVVTALMERSATLRKQAYDQTLDFFKTREYKVYGGHDTDIDKPRDWDELGGVPDILIWLSSWVESTAPAFQVWNMPLRCLNIYIPYGISLAENTEGTYKQVFTYNKPFCNVMWRLYTDSKINLEGYEIHEFLRGKNVRYSGFPKMDKLYEKRDYSESEIVELWPSPKDSGLRKRVIIAPHYSVFKNGIVLLSTFHHNLWFLLYLAEKYADQVSFVFKPHPNLKLYAVSAGLFESDEAYDVYIGKWESLPNARVVQEGDYLDHFATSDGMIMDSGSFVGEYLYTQKPCLFLTRPEQRFNKLGETCVNTYYHADGRDYAKIEAFLQNVILDGEDEMRALRRAVFDEALDYRKENGVLASEYIYRDITREM